MTKKGEKGGMFRYRKNIPLSYERQGYIYFTSRSYHRLGKKKQEKLRRLCGEAGGQYGGALFEFVTTDASATAVCLRHSISESSLYRVVRRYYLRFPETL